MEYTEFLEQKLIKYENKGFDISESQLNRNMFDFQKFITRLAIKKGKYAIFADTGLGKTLMQLEWARIITEKTKQPVLILCPLAVAQQTINEGDRFGIKAYKNDQNLMLDFKEHEYLNRIIVSNYEQIDNIDTSQFGGVVLDESSILKNFEGKTKQKIIDTFKDTSYKLACSATPSPNDPMELGNHAEFLDVMNRNQMLSMYFVHDGGATQKWRIKGHAISAFYKWVGSWSIMLTNPEDIGFDDHGYHLPDLRYIEEKIKTPKMNNGMLFNDMAVSATDFNKELRRTKQQRMQRVAEIVNGSSDKFLVWIRQNEEGEILKELIPDAIEVKGSDKDSYKKEKLIGFANNEFRVLITKQKIASFGLNYQNIHKQVFTSLDFSFEGLYQAIRRSYRYGQKHSVDIHIITTDTMSNVIQSINDKQKKFKRMQKEMSKNINVDLKKEKLSIIENGEEIKTNEYHIKRGDCVREMANIPDNSIDFSVYSPPFAELYTYSDHVEDMGNSKDYNEFMQQYTYLVNEHYRTTRPGRLVAVHCMDLPIQKGKEGYIGLRSFTNYIIKAFTDAGFIHHTEVTIWKNPVTEMQRTKALGLLHKQLKKDATMCRVGIPDKIEVFRKPGENTKPVKLDMPVEVWQKWASPIWTDIDYSKTLNFREGKAEKDEKHIAPLQLDTVKRLIGLYTNEGDNVLDPFLGIGTTVYQAVKMKRYGIGFELKESYFKQANKNIKIAVSDKKQTKLF